MHTNNHESNNSAWHASGGAYGRLPACIEPWSFRSLCVTLRCQLVLLPVRSLNVGVGRPGFAPLKGCVPCAWALTCQLHHMLQVQSALLGSGIRAL